MVVSRYRFHGNFLLVKFENGYILRTSAKIEDETSFLFFGVRTFIVKTISQGRGYRLCDYLTTGETCNTAGIFRCLSLRLSEIGGHSHDTVGHFAAEMLLRTELYQFE